MTTATTKRSVPINTIKITEKAANKVRQFATQKGMTEFGLKVAVKGGGCSGLTYVLEFVDGPEHDDKIIDSNDVQVYVPKKAFVFLAGTVLDFSDGLNGKGFEFLNPNAARTCGCGTSFSV
jgi:iron-sulfur cluster assembly protein